MNRPTEEQIERTINLLLALRASGNRRPGDDHIEGEIYAQLRARAIDIWTVLLNQEHILSGR
jgi:hypothetical protein